VIGRPNPIYLTNIINVPHVDTDDMSFTSHEEKKEFVYLLKAFRRELCRNG
jgi:hypothetical protein